jgi:HTH-type transcriptional regulator/antitoxin HigA
MTLLSQAIPAIETEEENGRMLKVIEKLMDKGEDLSPEEEKLLKLLTRLVEDFEERYYHPRGATPLEVLQHLMETREVKQTHLWEVFGSKGIASEVLNGKRGISKTHARALADYFHVPADLFI